uniref:U1 small nuclear ribonucleoprotein C n=1 Tax=Ascaris suum TaxID=6253 RepID=F1LDK4_ASCSU
MPKYYCDYCDTFLTHDSPSVRKTHNGGRKHKENVRIFYQKWMEEQAQKLVDATAKAYLQQKARIEATRALQKGMPGSNAEAMMTSVETQMMPTLMRFPRPSFGAVSPWGTTMPSTFRRAPAPQNIH